ncbi:MAG: MFS transporter [Syntrophobacteraceae bacterium]
MEALWAQRWRALGFVAALGFVFSANFTNHGPLVPILVKDLNITLAQAGFLTTAIFLTHGALQIPGGALADKLGAKRVVLWSLVIITVGNCLIGFCSYYYQILALKFIIGIGTGAAFIAGARYVPTFFAGKEIQSAQGVYGGSILLGSGFVIYGVPQLLAALAIIFTGIMAGLPFAGIFNGARDNCPDSPGVAMGFVNTRGAAGVMILPPIIGRLVDITGTFVSGFYVLAGVALAASLGCLALKPPRLKELEHSVDDRRPSAKT